MRRIAGLAALLVYSLDHVRVNRTDTVKTTLWTVTVVGVITALVLIALEGMDYSFP